MTRSLVLKSIYEDKKAEISRSLSQTYHGHTELAVSRLVLWAPTQGRCSHGRPQTTFVDTFLVPGREELRIAEGPSSDAPHRLNE